MSWACSRHEEKMNAYRVLVGNPEGKRLLGRTRRRWGDNIKMGVREIRWRGFIWLSKEEWRALVNTLTNLRIP
jgi:hypothetical protein